LLAGEALHPEVRRLVTHHLVRGCPECSRCLEALLADPVPEDATAQHAFGYDEALDRAWEGAQAIQRKLAHDFRFLPRALAALEHSPRGLSGLKQHERVAVQGLARVELLLAASFRERYRDPSEMVRLAQFARNAAEHDLPPELGETLRTDVQARVWAELGNAYRVAERLGEAETALYRAEALRQQGTGEPLLEARLRELQASLYRAQRRLIDAVFKLDEAQVLYQEVKDRHSEARVLSNRGIVLHHAERPREAVLCFRDGLRLVDRERDPELACSLILSLIYALIDCGENLEAGRLLLQSGLRKAFAGEPLKLLKLRNIEGLILAGRGDAKGAERVFREVRAAFTQHQQDYDAALVSFELAALWQKQGRFREIELIATEAQETFERLGVSDARSAAMVLRGMASYDFLDTETVTHLKRFVARHQEDRRLRFEWPPIFERLKGLA
jgi:tetratricopeptide (TPR) repeat protein